MKHIEVRTRTGNHFHACASYHIDAETTLLHISSESDPDDIIHTYREWESVHEVSRMPEHEREGIL